MLDRQVVRVSRSRMQRGNWSGGLLNLVFGPKPARSIPGALYLCCTGNPVKPQVSIPAYRLGFSGKGVRKGFTVSKPFQGS